MSSNFIRVWFTDEEDSTGMLTVEGRSGSFAGRGTACFRISELESFAEDIGAYPLPRTRPLQIRGGYLSSSEPAALVQEHLGLHVYPTNRRGGVAIQLRVATPLRPGERPESQSRAEFELHVTYEALRRFAGQFTELLQGKAREACIEGNADAA